jgi:hypothetical protein
MAELPAWHNAELVAERLGITRTMLVRLCRGHGIPLMEPTR